MLPLAINTHIKGLVFIATLFVLSLLSAQSAFGQTGSDTATLYKGSFTLAILDKDYTSDNEGVYWTVYRVHNNMTAIFMTADTKHEICAIHIWVRAIKLKLLSSNMGADISIKRYWQSMIIELI